jgi:hypothetical protein
LASGNYSFAFINGSLSVTKAPLTVTADNKTRIYGDPNPAFTASYSGFKNGQILGTSGVTGSPSLTTTATATSSVAGSPYPITAAVGTLASGNYSFNFVNGSLSITKALLVVTAQNATRQYGDPNPTFTSMFTGFKNSEDLSTSGVTGAASLTTTATVARRSGHLSDCRGSWLPRFRELFVRLRQWHAGHYSIRGKGFLHRTDLVLHFG